MLLAIKLAYKVAIYMPDIVKDQWRKHGIIYVTKKQQTDV